MRTFRSFRRALSVLLLVLWPALAISQTVSLDGATFGYQRTRPLQASIGARAVATPRIIRGVGGVAFVREAVGLEGWAVQRMRYDALAADGQRVVVTLGQRGRNPVEIRMPAWDWEIVPLARFVASPTDSAFTYFGELPEGARRTVVNGTVVSYHPALANTLMGLRLMQLDLFLFEPPFTGYFTDRTGTAILGAGERAVLGSDVNVADPEALKRLRSGVESRVDTAMNFLVEDCKRNPSRTCDQSDQPFGSYIVGDMISPVSFSVHNGSIAFRDRGVCWDFSREADPGEPSSPNLEGFRLLRPLSEAFCERVVNQWQGIHPLVYRTARRAMRFSALMRHYKTQDPAGYNTFVASMAATTLKPSVSTPTEIGIRRAISVDDSERFRQALERLRRQRD